MASGARKLAALFSGTLALSALWAHAQEDGRYTEVPRVVALADVHGAYGALTDLLEATGLVDGELAWTGGEAHLVSLGDLMDRGSESRAVMDLLIRLQSEAAAAGGRVHVVLGNHELMNLIGDLRYVSSAEYAAFADEEPAGARQTAYARFAAQADTGTGEIELLSAFEERYPPGYFGHRAAFAPEGRYGSWLLSLPALVIVNETVFVHGGLSELVARMGMEVNRTVHEKLRRYFELRSGLVEADILPRYDMERDRELAQAAREQMSGDDDTLGPVLEEFAMLADAPELGLEGPFWYRGSVYCNALLERPVLDAALERLAAKTVVVGHTPTSDRRVRELHAGSLVMLDTGMLANYYAGRPAALVIEGRERYVQYLSPQERDGIERGRVLAQGLTEPELLAALGAAEIVPGPSASPSSVRLRSEGRLFSARYYAADHDAARNELAAFTLDRLLGLGLVPPTVPRQMNGEAGALQLLFADSLSESDRIERQLPFGWCPIEPQLQLMHAFDLLTFNTGRRRDTARYRNDLSNLVLIDHGEAFGTRRTLPDALNPGDLALPDELVDALTALDAATLEASLGEWLGRREIRALLARRDKLLELD